jgi:uncharacterized protein YhfF
VHDPSTGPPPGSEWEVAQVVARLRAAGYEGTVPPVGWFGDRPDQTSELAELVVRGRERATAGLLWRWELAGGPPLPGGRQVIIDAEGTPRAVIEITDVRVTPFDDVDATFAAEEGRGDRSLASWRRVHWDFFTRECERLGRTPSLGMPVVCMRLRVVHSSDG